MKGGGYVTNTVELKIAILRANETPRSLADKLGISYTTFLNKLKNKREFKAGEIAQLVEILHIDNVEHIFFCKK
jgi:hypothetical protein